jgi:hypothetical protein
MNIFTNQGPFRRKRESPDLCRQGIQLQECQIVAFVCINDAGDEADTFSL